ncbi:hypothetical protein [Deinococcus murrayi]|uniref:hypothetical protein n=1 Tax=Deinococcus murrayi TaxID=68910 RepID=UPI0004865F9D|nr:hypothetical protein [Deinococcus murrayi]
MKLWRWLMTPDPEPGFTRRKLGRLLIRVLLFTVVATLLSGLLRLAGLGPYLDTWWGTLLFVLLLYVPFFRFLTVDTFVPGRPAVDTRQPRRRERQRYAGVRKRPPQAGGRRR